MKAAILAARAICKGRLFFVFGNMLELGDQSKLLHAEIGKFAVEREVFMMYGVGQHAGAAAALLPGSNGVFVQTSEKMSVVDKLLQNLRSHDMVLFKGSRGMELEVVYKELCERLAQA